MGRECCRAALFDIRGPFHTEVISEGLVDRDLLEAFAKESAPVTCEALREANALAAAAFALDAYGAVVWRLPAGDPGPAQRAHERGGFELQAVLKARSLLPGEAAS